MNDVILSINNVSKTYGTHKAVDSVSFDVPKGSIFGLLGPNGAGKTSLIRMITTITTADSGRILFNGEPLSGKHPERIGYMPEERGLYKQMTVGEQLLYLGQLKGLTAVQARTEIRFWFKKFDIMPWWDKKVEELSKGMQQKVQFIATVLHRPELIILDEPFSGLDPINANLIKDEIYELHRNGTTIIFSTHRMEQVDEICHRIVLIDKGRNVLEGEVVEVKNRFKQNLFNVGFKGELPERLAQDLNIAQLAAIEQQNNQKMTLKLANTIKNNDILQFLIDKKVQITEFHEILPSLNEIFINEVEKNKN